MNIIKTDKRIKYNNVFTLWAAFDYCNGLGFAVLDTIQNTRTKSKYLVLEVKQGYEKVNDKTLAQVRDALAKAYPRSDYKIITRQYKYAPEIKENVLLALCK